MTDFTIGQRVRIVCPTSSANGMTGTVYDIKRDPGLFGRLLGEPRVQWAESALRQCVHPRETAYLVDIDGMGRHCGFSLFDVWGFPHYWLRPLDDPKENAWADDKVKQVTKPIHHEPTRQPAPVSVR